MSYGLNIYNDAGLLAFSSDYSCYKFLGKFTLPRTGVAGQQYAILTVTSARAPLVFIAPNSTEAVAVAGISVSGTTWTINVESISLRTLTTINVYVFTVDQTLGTGYGINIFDASGNVTFSTVDRTLQISGYIISNAQTQVSTINNQALTYGSIPTNYATMTGLIGWEIRIVGPATQLYSYGINKVNATTVGFTPTRLLFQTAAPGSPSATVMGNQYAMFIDTDLYQ